MTLVLWIVGLLAMQYIYSNYIYIHSRATHNAAMVLRMYVNLYVGGARTRSREPEQPLGIWKLEFSWAICRLNLPFLHPELVLRNRSRPRSLGVLTGFRAEPTGSVLDSHRPREFWESTQSDTCMNSEFIGWIYDSVILRIRWSWVGLISMYECVP